MRKTTESLVDVAVDAFWVSELDEGPTVEHILPSGRAQVVVDLDAGTGLLIGPRTRPVRAVIPTCSAGFSLTGVGLAAIVGGDALELVDSAVDVDAIVRTASRDFPNELGDARACARRLAHLLITNANIDARIVAAEAALRSGRRTRDLTRLVEMDRRELVPAFRAAVGVAPKHYERLVRLQAAVRALRSGTGGSIAAIAANLGFADQAHLTRDVRALCGLTPSALRVLPGHRMNHVPIVLST